jgi:hypothetical protein
MSDRLISADALLKEALHEGAYGYVDAWEIENAPTVDAVEVVRCKDCEYLTIISEEPIYACCGKHNHIFYPWEEDIRKHFCSWGERKEDGNS